ncbi:serine/arginine-rich splicing factor 2-like [Numida meleagris]|uniref:serine/arginine-rich splicing factor 2-like n=1 Tax=Numida meleagris TaxID=8996 RepID=UPI000B3D94B7|nr:serine/arginine-rich splicing factor 2-like [Numida meleagris]
MPRDIASVLRENPFALAKSRTEPTSTTLGTGLHCGTHKRTGTSRAHEGKGEKRRAIGPQASPSSGHGRRAPSSGSECRARGTCWRRERRARIRRLSRRRAGSRSRTRSCPRSARRGPQRAPAGCVRRRPGTAASFLRSYGFSMGGSKALPPPARSHRPTRERIILGERGERNSEKAKEWGEAG